MVKEKGYYSFETDIRFTKDNIPVLLHDKSINRVARNTDFSKISSTILVKEHTLEELNSYIFPVSRDGKVLKKYSKNKITLFEDALKYCKENGIHMTIELKTGNQEQINSLVQLTQKYQMDNKVLWLSAHTQILHYIKLYDDDEYVQAGRVAEKERKSVHSLLDTPKRKAIVTGDNIDSVGYAKIIGQNLPEYASNYPQSNYKLDLIKKGSITLKKKTLSISLGKSNTVSYTYNGDGKVKCVSEDKTKVSCSVNKDKKIITIQGLSLVDNIKVNVYATQGTKYSATDDYSIEVKVNSDQAMIQGDINKDGLVTSIDYILVRKHILGVLLIPDADRTRADMNADGKINSLDYIYIRRKIIGL